MPLFTVTCTDKPDGFDLRAATRPAHLAYLGAHAAALKIAGPFLDAQDRPIGSLLIFEAPDLVGAQAFADNDPYAQAGLFVRVEVASWRLAVGGFAP